MIQVRFSMGGRFRMRESGLRTWIILAGALSLFLLVLIMRPGYLASPVVLGTMIVGQLVLASISKYRQSFFWVLMLAFLWAGVRLPMSGAWLEGRWVVLAAGALAGIAVYMRDPNHGFGAIHLVALFCVLSAAVSASVSAYPEEALLKSLSLFLLFLYGALGARVAVSRFEPEKFFRTLLRGCEVLTYISLLCYIGLRFPLFGNPNSLGAIMGVVIVPVMFWGFLSAESVMTRRRLGCELCLSVLLLMSSYSRAGIAAGTVSCLLILVALRHYRLMVTAMVAALAIAVLTVTFAPRPVELGEDSQSQSMASLFLYKGKPSQGLLGSRKGPWDQTLAVIQAHPWFGSGFGTSVTSRSAAYFEITRSRFIDSRMIREHGNSYLAILEWSGLLGVFPFYLLVGIALSHGKRALVELRRTGNMLSPAIPAAAIIVAGFVGAAFEDWLFAVGYYLSVFVWVIAFILADLIHPENVSPASDSRILPPDHGYPAPTPAFAVSPVPLPPTFTL
jgi:O-antigen ligase